MAIPSPRPVLSDLPRGRVVLPGDADWDDARQGFNTLVEQHPAAVVLPADARDVIAAVDFAREHGLRIAPQATGHNAAPLGSLDGTLLVNVAALQEVSIDAERLRVRVGAGVKWERVVPRLSELGLAALHGSSPDVGIAGYSLGGGLGWLGRRHGLHTNKVLAMEIVTAEGRLVRADAEHEPELFWALRGGGGSYGVLTAIEFAVLPIPELYAGATFFPYERAAEVMHAWAAGLPAYPEELTSWIQLLRFPDAPDVPEPVRGGAYAVLLGAHLGGEREGRELLAPVRALGPVMDTFATVPPIALAELAMDPPHPLPFASAHQLLGELPASGIEGLAAAVSEGPGTSLSLVQLRHMGGALARTSPGAGARATLPGEVSLFMAGVIDCETAAEQVPGGLAAAMDALRPHRVGEYPNFVKEPAETSAFYDEVTWRRLRKVKARYDPGDLFRGNHHVPPAE